MHAVTGTGRLIAGRYRLQGPVGRGAMGIVWRGRDELLHRDVAVKQVQITALTLPAEAEVAYQRTLREARTAARLSHPAVVTVFDVVEEDGSPWIIMEFIGGRSLEQVIAEDGPLPPLHAAELGARLLGALETAHAAGVLHRDVKPSNVLISADGRAVLTDFGIATFAEDPGITQAGMVVGTPGFTAPERVRGGSATPASDLWSLGATLYAAVEGRGPFERPGGSMAIIDGVAAEDAPRAPSAGPLAPVIEALLSRDPDQRPDAAGTSALLADAVAASTATHPAAADPGYNSLGYNSQGRDSRGRDSLSYSQRIMGPGSRALSRLGYLNPAKGADPARGSDPARGADPARGSDPARGADPARGSDPARGADPARAAGQARGAGPDAAGRDGAASPSGGPGWDGTAGHDPGWDGTAGHDPGWDGTAGHDPGWDGTAGHDPGWDGAGGPGPGWDGAGGNRPGEGGPSRGGIAAVGPGAANPGTADRASTPGATGLGAAQPEPGPGAAASGRPGPDGSAGPGRRRGGPGRRGDGSPARRGTAGPGTAGPGPLGPGPTGLDATGLGAVGHDAIGVGEAGRGAAASSAGVGATGRGAAAGAIGPSAIGPSGVGLGGVGAGGVGPGGVGAGGVGPGTGGVGAGGVGAGGPSGVGLGGVGPSAVGPGGVGPGAGGAAVGAGAGGGVAAGLGAVAGAVGLGRAGAAGGAVGLGRAGAAGVGGIDAAQPGHGVREPAESFLAPPDFARLRMPEPGDDLAGIADSLSPDAVAPGPADDPGTGYADRTAGLPEFMDPPKDASGPGGPDGPAGTSGPAAPAGAQPGGSNRSMWSRHWRLATAGGAIAAIVVAAVIGLGVYSGSLAAGSPVPETQPGAPGPGPRVTARTEDTPRPSTGTRPTAGTGGASGGAGQGSDPSPSHSIQPSQGTSAKPTTSPTHPAGGGHGSKSPGTGSGMGAAPAGYEWHTVTAATLGTTAGFAIAAPDGWQLTITGKTADLAEPGGHGRVAVSLHPWMFAGAMREARDLQKVAKGNDPGYQFGAVRPTDFMAVTAAVSRFSWQPVGRTHRTVVLSELVTLATAAGVQPYQMTLSVGTPYMAASRPVYEKMLSTFQPLT